MPSVLILLAVYQGEQFLEEQLRSLSDQTIENINILASDDGSTDRSMAILKTAQKSWKKGFFEIIQGPQDGFAANFRTLLRCSKTDADYFAFCDQDDIWDSDKLERALIFHASLDYRIPAVCGSTSRIINESGRLIGQTPQNKRPPSFQHAMVENLMPGHTMVMNKTARDVLVCTAKHIGQISHDYWIYLILTGVGGIVYQNPIPSVSYRYHQSNAIARNVSWKDHFWRFDRTLTEEVRRRASTRISALKECAAILKPSARSTLQSFEKFHNGKTFSERWTAIAQSGVYRQSQRGQLGLKIDCLLGLL